jgi:hypothetical protein
MNSSASANSPSNPDGAPALDPTALERALGRIELLAIELVHSRFTRADDGALRTQASADWVPQIAIDVDSELSADGTLLGCLIRLATMSDRPPETPDQSEPEDSSTDPYFVQAEYRVLYTASSESSPLSEAEIDQVAYWEATATIWPYFRAHLADLLERAGLPRLVLPHLRRRPT